MRGRTRFLIIRGIMIVCCAWQRRALTGEMHLGRKSMQFPRVFRRYIKVIYHCRELWPRCPNPDALIGPTRWCIFPANQRRKGHCVAVGDPQGN